eukprot:15454869-Alexandrium_andersonii.AAC.1
MVRLLATVAAIADSAATTTAVAAAVTAAPLPTTASAVLLLLQGDFLRRVFSGAAIPQHTRTVARARGLMCAHH